jgi:hypothetical protein
LAAAGIIFAEGLARKRTVSASAATLGPRFRGGDG